MQVALASRWSLQALKLKRNSYLIASRTQICKCRHHLSLAVASLDQSILEVYFEVAWQ